MKRRKKKGAHSNSRDKVPLYNKFTRKFTESSLNIQVDLLFTVASPPFHFRDCNYPFFERINYQRVSLVRRERGGERETVIWKGIINLTKDPLSTRVKY